MHIKFHKDWFKHSKVNRGDKETHRQHGEGISLLSFFLNKENRLKIIFDVTDIVMRQVWSELSGSASTVTQKCLNLTQGD
jgi:hypothetical protein